MQIGLPRHKRTHFFALAISLLAFGLFVQAVHAKNSDYFPHKPPSVRFSTTIKIADLVHHVDFGTPATVAVFPDYLLPSPPPPVTRLAVFEIPISELVVQFSFRPLRSPPITL